MLRIEKDGGGCVTKLRLSGRIQSDQIASISSELEDSCATKILDLSEVTLVDLTGVRFLMRCEDEGVALVQCPPYIREWMLRERAEGAYAKSPNAP
jgi:anti-anti-sigma regulatory factor